MSDPGRKRAVAVFATIGAVVFIVAIARHFADEDTEDANRAWYGEQWDVARNCVVGTPIGRGDDQDVVTAQVESRAYEMIAALDAGADPESVWPLSCLGLLAALRDAPDLPQDPVPRLAALELAIARMPAAPLGADVAVERARAIAGPVVTLDALMPSGAEYDPARHPLEDPGAGREAIRRSHACPPPRIMRRPFLAASVGGETLHDERVRDGVSERLIGEGDTLRLARSGPGVDEERSLEPGARRLPRFFDDDRIGWIVDGATAVVVLHAIEGEAFTLPRALGAPSPTSWVTRDGTAILRTGAAAWLVRWSAPADAVPLEPAPPDAGVVWTVDGDVTALAWFVDGRWRGHVCEDICRPMPALEAGGDLQLALRGRALFALVRGGNTELTLGHHLPEHAGRWDAPIPMSRGALEGGDRWRVTDCEGALVSEDGLTWSAVDR